MELDHTYSKVNNTHHTQLHGYLQLPRVNDNTLRVSVCWVGSELFGGI